MYERPEEGIGSPVTGVTASCELPSVGARNNSGPLQMLLMSTPLYSPILSFFSFLLSSPVPIVLGNGTQVMKASVTEL